MKLVRSICGATRQSQPSSIEPWENLTILYFKERLTSRISIPQQFPNNSPTIPQQVLRRGGPRGPDIRGVSTECMRPGEEVIGEVAYSWGSGN